MATLVTEESELDTLTTLVENGPLWDGFIKNKSAKDILIKKGLATNVVANGSDGYVAAAYAGRDIYKKIYGESSSIREAKTFRINTPDICRYQMDALNCNNAKYVRCNNEE